MRHLKYWLHKRARPTRYQLLSALLEQQKLTQSQLLKKQEQDLTKIIEFAKRHTNYYKNR